MPSSVTTANTINVSGDLVLSSDFKTHGTGKINITALADCSLILPRAGVVDSVGYYDAQSSPLILTPAQAGYTIYCGTGATITLPPAAAVLDGQTVTVIVYGTSSTVQPSGDAPADRIYALNSSFPAGLPGLALGQGSSVVLQSNGLTQWNIVGGSAMAQYTAEFARSHAINGYQKLPGGMIMQWGTCGPSTAGIDVQPFVIAFPTQCTGTFMSTGLGNSTTVVAQVHSYNTISFTWSVNTASNTFFTGQTCTWMAIGY